MKHTRPVTCRGFTLLELLVAVAVFAIMATMAYGGLNNVIMNSEMSTESMQRLQQVQLAMLKLNRDFGQVTRRNIRDEYGNSTNFLMTGSDPDVVIEFTRGGHRNPAELLRSHLERVAYRLDDNRLIRMSWTHLDRSQGAEPVETELLDDVTALEVRYLDSEKQWHNEWPPLSSGGTGGTLTLAGIELRMELTDWGELWRFYALGKTL